MKKAHVLLIVILISVLLTGCSDLKGIKVEEIDQISLNLIKVKSYQTGVEYVIELMNNSEYVIKQNEVYLSYPIIKDSETKSSNYHVKATNNKLNIQPGEKVKLVVHTPYEGMPTDKSWSLETVEVKMEGYLEKVEDEYMFTKGRSFTINQ